MTEAVADIKSKRSEIVAKMRALTSEYQALAQELAELDAPEKRAQVEAEQRRRFESFKKSLTVEATTEAKEIDYVELEAKIFDPANLDELVIGTGYMLTFDSEGQSGFCVAYAGGNKFTPFAYDKVDAERYVKRQRRKEHIAKK